MRIRTTEQLYDKLSEELAWRIRELDQIRALVRSSASSRTKREAAIRSGVAILYAHWEGFIKEAATAYLNFVAEQDLSYSQLSTNFVAIAMKGKLNEASQTSKASIYNQVAEFFLTKLSEKCRIPWKTVINTKSNLSSSVFKEIISILGFDYTHFATKEKLIDHTLLHSRNNIAHGQYLLIDEDTFFELFEEILGMIQLFRNLIDNAASTKSFLKTA